jgi:Mn2+/Fe2+ NRAMP family transporter
MAASAQLVLGLPTIVWTLLFGAALVLSQIYLSYKTIAAILKWLTASLLAYVITAFIVHPPWVTIFSSTFLPRVHFDAQWLTTLLGVLGTTISPYLFFWQAAMCVEEEKSGGRRKLAHRRGATEQEIAEEMLDTDTGMAYSNLIFYFIVLTTAATLGAHGITRIATADDAARALEPLAGPFASALFALGMVGTGMLAVPTLSGSSAYAIADTFGLRGGLNEKPQRARRFYQIIAVGTGIGVAMNLFHIDPIRALFWSAVFNGLAAVPLLVFVTLLANDKKLLGRWTNSPLANFWAWLTTALMATAAVLMFVFWGQ